MPGQPGGEHHAAVLAHCQSCAECRRWFDSAAVARSLVKIRASHEFEPSPFFKTRVLAAIRDRGPITTLWSAEKMWRSTRIIVASMCALVVILLALNLFAPRPIDGATAVDTRGGYAVERIVMDDNSNAPDENLTSGQVLDTVFATGDSYGID
jgi:hypothetical protein